MRMRMVWWREAKWLFAAYVLDFFFRLTKQEASPDMLRALFGLSENFESDPVYQIVPMRTINN